MSTRLGTGVRIATLIGLWLVACGTHEAPVDSSASETTLFSSYTPSPTPEPTFSPVSPSVPTATETLEASRPPVSTPSYDPFTDDVPPADITFTLPPTVQYVSETSAVIAFELRAPSTGALFYRPANGQIYAITLSPDQRNHVVVLEELSPAMTYEYVVRLGVEGDHREPLFADTSWGSGTFRTSPYGPPIRVAVIGDSGFGDSATFALVEQMASYQPDIVLHTGDVVYNISEDGDPYAAFTGKFYLPFAPVLRQGPVYPVVGNHDVMPTTWWEGVPFYYLAFPPLPSDLTERRQWYALTFGDVQFLMLDTQTFFGEAGGQEQQTWLEQRLADPRFTLTVPVFHVPPYSNGMHPNDGQPIRAAWVPLFEAAGVPLVLCGHEHYYERVEINGVTYVTTGGGSATLYTAGEHHAGRQAFARLSHFVLIEIDPDRISLQALNIDVLPIDQITLNRRQN